MRGQSACSETVALNSAEYVKLCGAFGDRYGFTNEEKEAMRLSILYGLENEEIAGYMKVAPETLCGFQACMTGKTRTRSVRELQALFLRYVLLRTGLPAKEPETYREQACV